jgi:hypothetical protein
VILDIVGTAKKVDDLVKTLLGKTKISSSNTRSDWRMKEFAF